MNKPKTETRRLPRMVSPRRGQFYKGIEWLACWLLDNVEGETVTEEQLRPWAIQAWKEHLKRANGPDQRPADEK